VSSRNKTEAGSQPEPASVVRGPLPDDTALWLIRHGETEWSRSGQHTSRTDLPLTRLGEQQAVALGEILHDVRVAYVMCSPRQRALRTAELAKVAVDTVDPDLAEWDYGDYEGLTTKQIQDRVPGWSLWTHPLPGGETASDVSARADRVLRRAAPHIADGPIVLIAHGHIGRVLAVRWIGLPALDGGRFTLGTAAPSVFGAEHGVPVIDRWNMPNPVQK
jgi:broad specificity phosphatase PhoE